MYDMAVHNPPSREALLQMNEAQVYGDLFHEVRLYRPPEPNNLHASIGILVGPRDAGYYSYVMYVIAPFFARRIIVTKLCLP